MPFSPTPFRDPDMSRSSKDWRNIAVFLVLTLVLGYAFDTYIIKPRQAALEAHQKAVLAAAAALPKEEVALAPAPRPRDEIVAQTKRVTLENDQMVLSVPMLRARLDDLRLKKYFTALDQKEDIALMMPPGTAHPTFGDTGWMAADDAMPVPDAKTVWMVRDQSKNAVTFEWANGKGLIFSRQMALDDQFVINVTDSVRNTGKASVTLTPYASITQGGIPEGLQTGIVHEGAVGYVGDRYVEQKYKGWADLNVDEGTYTAPTGWMGITSRYFFTGIIPPQGEQTNFSVRYQDVQNKADKNAQPLYQVDTLAAARTIAPGAEVSYETRFFAGAKKLRVLDTYEQKLGLKHFDLVMDFGWFYFLTKPFYYALVMINDLVGNFGVAILVFTALLRLAVFPLANASFKSFANMKRVQPQIQELQKAYISDKRKMQEELVKLYQKEKVNPLSGCLPILVQIPVFFAMYKVISVSIDMRHAPFFGWIRDLSAPDPTSIINLFGLLPYDVPSFFHFGIWPTLLFVMIMIQVRLSPPPPDAMMRIFFSYYYPVVVCFIMAKFAAGLVIYWSFSAFLSITQQIVIMQMMGVPVHLFERIKAKTKPTAPDKVSS